MTETLTHASILRDIEGRNSPVAAPWPDHPWESINGRIYFYSHDVDGIERGWRISVGDHIFMAYTLQLPTGWKDGARTWGDPIDFWEHIPDQKNAVVKMKF